MNYEYQIDIPPQTPDRAPFITTLHPMQKFLMRVDVEFISPSGTTGVALFDEGRQFAPLFGWVTSGKGTLVFTPRLQLQGPPYNVVVKGYNNAIDWPHRVIIRLECQNSR